MPVVVYTNQVLSLDVNIDGIKEVSDANKVFAKTCQQLR